MAAAGDVVATDLTAKAEKRTHIQMDSLCVELAAKQMRTMAAINASCLGA